MDADAIYDVVHGVAREECFEIGRRLFENISAKLSSDEDRQILTHAVATAMSIITHTIMGSAYGMLKNGTNPKAAWEWLQAAIEDVQLTLDHCGADFKYTLNEKPAATGGEPKLNL